MVLLINLCYLTIVKIGIFIRIRLVLQPTPHHNSLITCYDNILRKSIVWASKALVPLRRIFYIVLTFSNFSVCYLQFFSLLGEIYLKWKNIFPMYFALSSQSFLEVAMSKRCSGFRQRVSHRKTL